MGESTYFIGFMLPTFGIICKLGGFCGPFGPRVGKCIVEKRAPQPSLAPWPHNTFQLGSALGFPQQHAACRRAPARYGATPSGTPAITLASLVRACRARSLLPGAACRATRRCSGRRPEGPGADPSLVRTL